MRSLKLFENKKHDNIAKYTSIALISAMHISLCSLIIEQNTTEFFSNPHTTIEYLESDYHAFIRTNKDIPALTKAIRVYTKNLVSSKKYAELIVSESRTANLDPWLVFAVISKESSFNPDAKSYVGAIGLMQVMPFWKIEIGVSTDDLYDPRTSIVYGTQILNHYLKRYGNVHKALSAYNGSIGSSKYPNAVMKKMKQGKDRSA